MKVLVINSGSSSIKYEFFDMSVPRSLATGLLEQIGEPTACLRQKIRTENGPVSELVKQSPVADHRSGLKLIGATLAESGLAQDLEELYGIGHRVVHGGEAFTEPTLINNQVLATIRAQIPLAPLHNPANLTGIEEALSFAAHVPQVAVFDTAFHQTMPPHAYHYALPRAVYTENRVRRYGFHGTSHRYVTRQAARYLQQPLDETNLIVFHLGNGASAAAVQGGKSIDTSLGMTPLEGLIMGTRCGDLDPAISFYLMRETGRTAEQVESLLNKESGLKGICGDNDMREVLKRVEAGDEWAQLALDMVTYRIKKYLGAYFAVLGRVDGVVFTAGIGENVPVIRERACANLGSLGIVIDSAKNNAATGGLREIQTEDSSVKVLVIPTDEELQIAELTVACIQAKQ
ncbi:acetate kinase [Planctomycetota bacterium]